VATDVERVLGGVAPHLLVTDPPFGVSYGPAIHGSIAPHLPGKYGGSSIMSGEAARRGDRATQ
jgi:hypothetical protein